MSIRVGGSVRPVKISDNDYTKALAAISPSGTGKGGANVLTGDGSKSLLQLLQESDLLNEIATLTLSEPVASEEEALAYVPGEGVEVAVVIGVQIGCLESTE